MLQHATREHSTCASLKLQFWFRLHIDIWGYRYCGCLFCSVLLCAWIVHCADWKSAQCTRRDFVCCLFSIGRTPSCEMRNTVTALIGQCNICATPLNTINLLALELDVYSLAHHLCKMWTFYEPRSVTLGNTRHFVEE